jgi:hypothetical protein
LNGRVEPWFVATTDVGTSGTDVAVTDADAEEETLLPWAALDFAVNV